MYLTSAFVPMPVGKGGSIPHPSQAPHLAIDLPASVPTSVSQLAQPLTKGQGYYLPFTVQLTGASFIHWACRSSGSAPSVTAWAPTPIIGHHHDSKWARPCNPSPHLLLLPYCQNEFLSVTLRLEKHLRRTPILPLQM